MEPAIAKLGVPYRTQHPLWGLRLFPDFVLLQQKVVIEIDDASHRTTKKRREDAERTRRLQAAGWRVVRCWNEEALEDPHGTLDRILAPLKLQLPRAAATPDTEK